MNFEDEGTNRITFEDGGEVGIGTASPNWELTVYDSVSGSISYAQFITGSTGSAETDGMVVGYNSNLNAAVLSNIENEDLMFGTNNLERARIEADGEFQFSIRANPDTNKGADLGRTGLAWNDIYFDDAFNEGAPAWENISVINYMKNNSPSPKPEGTYDAVKNETGLRELSPGSVILEMTNYFSLKSEYETCLNITNTSEETACLNIHPNPENLEPEELAISINAMTSWNYKAIYELVQENIELKTNLSRQQDEIDYLYEQLNMTKP